MTKKPAKKTAAKKAAPKLIDGKFSHVFNLRLEPEVGKAMEGIVKKYGFKANTKAVHRALLQHEKLVNEVEELKMQLRTLTHENNVIKERVWNYLDASKELNNVITSNKDNSISKSFRNLLDDENDDPDKDHCGECGSLLDEDDTICPECGAVV